MQAHQIYKEIFSPSNLQRLFWEKIFRSAGVGKDGIRKQQFLAILSQETDLIHSKTENETYNFTPYKERLISKGAGKIPRQISIATFRDRLTQRALCNLLNKVFNSAIGPPPQTYIKKIRDNIQRFPDSKKNNYCFLRLDVKEYFPSIEQDLLLKKIRAKIRKPQILSLIRKAIQTPTGGKRSKDNLNFSGVPQGLSISNILSSIYLQSFDKWCSLKFDYYRYVDDILIVCKKTQAQKIYAELNRELKKLSLECHELGADNGKSTITPLDEGVDYLGYHLTINSFSVRQSSYRRMYFNLLKVFTQFRHTKNEKRLLWRLNLKISGCYFDQSRRGWMFFFSQTQDKNQLMTLDNFVKKHLKKLGVGHLRPKIKTFIKTYFEINYRYKNTQYIPNFATYTQTQMIETIIILTDKKMDELKTWQPQEIERIFQNLVFREISQLEKDLQESFS